AHFAPIAKIKGIFAFDFTHFAPIAKIKGIFAFDFAHFAPIAEIKGIFAFDWACPVQPAKKKTTHPQTSCL
ncbi:hypothetical protein, partial [Paenibacillus sp. DMB5]|uniref:hypothetical protein n=1 Tax=Paenibacillus sp. DMB5 TaxID=1780103 RepID=UPI0012FF9D86